jgi:hypothetical protein
VLALALLVEYVTFPSLPLMHHALPAHICYVITYHTVPRLVEFRRRSWCWRWLCWLSMLPSPPPSHAPLMHSPLPAHICYVITYHTVPRLVEFRRRSWCWRWLCWLSMLPSPPPSHAPLMHSPLPAHICYVITYHTVPRLVGFRRRSRRRLLWLSTNAAPCVAICVAKLNRC